MDSQEVRKQPTKAQQDAFMVIGVLCSSIGLVSTFLFQIISKKDNDLRQRGRYLVTLQGYSGTIFLTFILYFGAFESNFPCFALFHDIYQTRFADPTDLAEVTRGTPVQGNNNRTKERTLIPAHGFSSSRMNPSIVNLSTIRHQSTVMRSQQDSSDRVFELTHKSPKDIARSNRWYNRYKKATDRQMLITGVVFMIISTIIDLCFQFTKEDLQRYEKPFHCNDITPYIFPYVTTFLFLFVLSPTMILQLNGVNDGYGIRKELISISMFSIPCIVLYFVLPKIAKEFTDDYVDRNYFMAAILVAAHVPSILVPLARHFKANHHKCRFRNKGATAAGQSTGAEGVGATNGDSDHGQGRTVGMSSDNIPSEGGSTQSSSRQQWNGSQGHLSPPPPEVKYGQQGIRDHLPVHSNNQQENNFAGRNLSIKNIIRNQRRHRFGFGGTSTQGDTIQNMKADWDEFTKALEDRRVFDHISAFTVAEFCAENTRFLYEVARLEKRATQYERLRNLTSGSQDVVEQVVGGPTDASAVQQQGEIVEKGSTASARDSTIGPLPTHFPSAHRIQLDDGKGSQRIKKIVSVSSVSSTMPMLGARRSSSSLFDESEPSSPLGSSSHSTFRRYGGSSVAPDLEEGIAENLEAGSSSTPIHLDIINMPTTPFEPLPMPPTLVTQFEYVYNTFIVRGARLELNLSYETAQEIHQKARKGEWSSGIFDGATYEVQELLFRDVWPKFVSSSRGLQSVEPLEEEYDPSDKYGTTTTGSRTTVFLPFDHHQLSRQPTGSSPAHSIKSPKASLSKATSTRSVATSSIEPSLAAGSDTFLEEPSRTGFKTWLDKKNRGGITAATLISREGATEESLGIIEQSRRSMIDHRSDTSGLHTNTTLTPPN
ncbi:hypothetical protein BGX33_007929 [Mortierella sp. NVP41]|nr:hypothetical protein BGX33_007929 [Mortierella sp. NVP41]